MGPPSEIPALRIRDEKVAESLYAGDRFEFFRVDEIGVERDGVGLAEQLHETAVLLDQIIRQHRDTEPAVRGPLPSRATSISQRERCKYDGTLPPPSTRTRWLSRSSKVRGVPNLLRYSGEA